MKQFFSLLLILFTTHGASQDCYVDISGEWLYMLSAIDQPYYYLTADPAIITGVIGDRIPNDQGWHSGYRIDLSYRFNCADSIRARWTQFPNFSDKNAIVEEGFPVLVVPDPITLFIRNATIRDQIDLYTLDILYEREFYCQRPLFLTFQAGVQFGHIDMNEFVQYISAGNESVVKNQSKVRGVGPEIGVDMRYNFCHTFDIHGRALASLLVSKKEAKFKQSLFPDLLGSTENETYWLTTPTLNIRFGLAYQPYLDLCGFCGTIGIEIGYEFIHFVNGVNRIYFMDTTVNAQAVSTTQQMDFTLHGPYVHLGICF